MSRLIQQDFGPNAPLIGKDASRNELLTPALVLDLDAFQQNVDTMLAFCRERNIGLRPHAKTHKSAQIARRQLEAGAGGICTATLGEAEILSDGGIDGLLITSPVVQPAKIARLIDLNARTDNLMTVIDHISMVDRLAVAASDAEKPLSVLVDLDPGLGRTGAATAADGAALALSIRDRSGLRFCGFQSYAGHLQHIPDYQARLQQAKKCYAVIDEMINRLQDMDLPPDIVTGGGTGTHEMDADSGLFTELQAGSFIFTDVDYDRVALREQQPRPFTPALFVQTSVISVNSVGKATTDAGLKRFATDGPVPTAVSGVPEGARYAFQGDEHGAVLFTSNNQSLPLGAKLECQTPHCDPTVNLYDVYHVVQGDRLVDIWPVDARGAI